MSSAPRGVRQGTCHASRKERHAQGLHRGDDVDRRLHLGAHESGFDQLFQWYGSDDVEMTTTHEDLTFRLTPQSAEHVRAMIDMTGALVVGRHLFDITRGWDGSHPIDLPVGS